MRLNELAERYYGADGNRKPPTYLAEYEKLFGQMRHARLRLLELGVKFGASMFLWADYFPSATVVGLDIENKPQDFPTDQRSFRSGKPERLFRTGPMRRHRWRPV